MAFDTSKAAIVTQVDKNIASTFVAPQDSLLNYLNIQPLPYGMRHWTRSIPNPSDDVHISVEFERKSSKQAKIVQDFDLIGIMKSIDATELEVAGDPGCWEANKAGVAGYYRDGLERTAIEGSTNPLMYGIGDQGAGTGSTTVSRPDAVDLVAATSAWSTEANMRADFIKALMDLINAGFTGPKLAIMPEIALPMLSNLIANTAVPVGTWFKSAIGIPICFSSQCRENDASGTYAAPNYDISDGGFSTYVIDLSRCHLALTEIKVKSYDVAKDHAVYQDWEVYGTMAFDPLHDGTDWNKGVRMIDNCGWQA